jgi:hypothetical protein
VLVCSSGSQRATSAGEGIDLISSEIRCAAARFECRK